MGSKPSKLCVTTQRISKEEAKEFMENCLIAAGACEHQADEMAEMLAMADYRGHYGQGLNRLEKHIQDLRDKVVDGMAMPAVVKETTSTAYVDGKNALGAAVGNFCMELAIEKAKDSGVGWVVAKGSNHYGISGYYAMKASQQGLIGFSFTNAPPRVRTNRSKCNTLGTNPISCAAPGSRDSFVLDVATSAASWGQIETSSKKGVKIPKLWGVDKDGAHTDDLDKVLNGGGLLPLGGSEETGGYKGFGLAMMVEILCGITAGSASSTGVKLWDGTKTKANLGQCFIAVNPRMFSRGFESRMQDFLDLHRNLDPIDPDKPVLIPGDPEITHMMKCDKKGGVPYPVQLIERVNKLAKELKVDAIDKADTLES